ncbi:MAG: hypothetical protein JSV14_16765 [Deltaproteobacteria bacterium]|nr:MAG: hypothetical protein JSV14_16765 [Deltaproteobacteria bacterium]
MKTVKQQNSNRLTVALASGLVFFLAVYALTIPAQAASSFKVGNFRKSQASAPATQVVAHGLGEAPKALILWTAGGYTTSFKFGIGFTDGSTSKSASAASKDGCASSEVSATVGASSSGGGGGGGGCFINTAEEF